MESDRTLGKALPAALLTLSLVTLLLLAFGVLRPALSRAHVHVYLSRQVLSLPSLPAPFVVERVVGATFIVGGTHQHGPKNWQAWTVDVLGAIGVAGRLGQDSDSGSIYQFVDTDVTTYNDDTVTVDWSATPTHVISIGSSFVNIFTYEYETHGGVPFYMTEMGGQPVIHSDSTGSDYGSGSGPPAYDHAVIALVFDSSVERYVMLVYGVTGKGSQAACMVLQNYDFYNGILRGRAVIIRWEDANGNGLADMQDPITQIETHAQAGGLVVYEDPALTVPLTEINFGTLRSGEEKNHTAYIKNESNVPLTLVLTTENWSPLNASSFIALTWNYDEQLLGVDSFIEVTFTLTVDPAISGIDTFSFDIVIVGSG